MKFQWLLAASLIFSGVAFADDDTTSKDKAKVETKSTATVTVVVMDKDGNVIKESSTTKESSDESSDAKGSGGEGKKQTQVRVESKDGKQVVELTLPDGTKKTIDLDIPELKGSLGGAPAKAAMGWVFRVDEDGEGNVEISKMAEELSKKLGNLDVDVRIDAAKIATEMKDAIIKIAPSKVLDGKVLDGKMLFEIGESAIVVTDDVSEEEVDGNKLLKRFQVRRMGGPGDGMAAVLEKLESLSKRLEKIEAQLDAMSKDK